MKHLYLLLLLLTTTTVYAQDTLEVKSVEKTMSRGKQTGFMVGIPQSQLKEVIADWKKYMHHKSKSSYKEINEEYILSKTIIPEITSDSIILYTIFSTPNGTDIELTSFICSKDSVFYNESGNQEITKNFKTFIRNFAVNHYRIEVQEELEVENRKLKLLGEELTILEKENESSENKIHTNERSNDRLRSDIKGNLKLQEINSSAIAEQYQVVGTYMEKSDLKKAEQKKLNELEKGRKKLQKENESFHEDIEENERANKELQKKIDTNVSENIPAKKGEIEKQKEVVAGVEVKLKGIK